MTPFLSVWAKVRTVSELKYKSFQWFARETERKAGTSSPSFDRAETRRHQIVVLLLSPSRIFAAQATEILSSSTVVRYIMFSALTGTWGNTKSMEDKWAHCFLNKGFYLSTDLLTAGWVFLLTKTRNSKNFFWHIIQVVERKLQISASRDDHVLPHACFWRIKLEKAWLARALISVSSKMSKSRFAEHYKVTTCWWSNHHRLFCRSRRAESAVKLIPKANIVGNL